MGRGVLVASCALPFICLVATILHHLRERCKKFCLRKQNNCLCSASFGASFLPVFPAGRRISPGAPVRQTGTRGKKRVLMSIKHEYLNGLMERVIARNPAEPEFHQAVREVLTSLVPVVEAGEAVLEDLLKAQELDDALVHAGVEPQAALVGADGGVELHPVAPVDLDLTGIVHPGPACSPARG